MSTLSHIASTEAYRPPRLGDQWISTLLRDLAQSTSHAKHSADNNDNNNDDGAPLFDATRFDVIWHRPDNGYDSLIGAFECNSDAARRTHAPALQVEFCRHGVQREVIVSVEYDACQRFAILFDAPVHDRTPSVLRALEHALRVGFALCAQKCPWNDERLPPTPNECRCAVLWTMVDDIKWRDSVDAVNQVAATLIGWLRTEYTLCRTTSRC